MSTDIANLQREIEDARLHLRASQARYAAALEKLKLSRPNDEEFTPGTEQSWLCGESLDDVDRAPCSVRNLDRTSDDDGSALRGVETATIAIDAAMKVRNYTSGAKSIFSRIDTGRPIQDVLHPIESLDLLREIQSVLHDRGTAEHTLSCLDDRTSYLLQILPYPPREGEVDGALLTFVNVSTIVAAEKQRRVLVSELNHRVRNMLQVVIGLCNQTLHRSADLRQFADSFMGRLQALARAYELLSREGWKSVAIADLLRTQLEPFASDERYSASGVDVVLAADSALGFGLALYELAANATKYGALSIPAGRLVVRWSVAAVRQKDSLENTMENGAGRGALIFEWIELDGPEVDLPEKRGLGSELIERQLRYELNGEAAMTFDKTGLHVTLTIPMTDALQLSS